MRSLDETKKIIDSVSDSFCAAKWYNATIWLSNGRTASCHHPIAHSIPIESIQKDPSALHNTEYKKEQRKLMLSGERPSECSYCWRVEDNNDTSIFSDRIYKSHIYSIKDMVKLKDVNYSENIDPKTLEISFDNLCNLSCTYCNPEFSSTWSSDIKSNGIYENLLTPGGSTYTHSSEYTLPLNPKEENIYIEKFFEWYNSSLKYGLQELRVTGGEPSRSPHFWKLLEQCTDANFDFAVNSNLIMSEARLKLLIDAASRFKKFDLYTSCESYGKHAEFVRHGLKYDVWKNNLKSFVANAKFNSVHIMMTISALSIWSIVPFMEDIISIRKELGNNKLGSLSLNILRFPSFQSINVISEPYKVQLASDLEIFAVDQKDMMSESEINQILRVASYLRNVEKSYEDTDNMDNKINDFVNFVQQYATRRSMVLSDYLPDRCIQWFNTLIKDTHNG